MIRFLRRTRRRLDVLLYIGEGLAGTGRSVGVGVGLLVDGLEGTRLPCQQGLGVADLDDPAGRHDNDQVAVPQELEPVRDLDDGPAAHLVTNHPAHLVVGPRVDAARRLVQQHDGAAAQQRPRQAKQLQLARRQAQPGHVGVEPAAARDGAPDGRLPERLLQRAVVSRGAPGVEVAPHRAAQHDAVLRQAREPRPHRPPREEGQVPPVDGDAAPLNVQQPRERQDERRLAAAVGPLDVSLGGVKSCRAFLLTFRSGRTRRLFDLP
ncbi:hypothetical protein J3459_011002 [Metarhizium acridum]|nr:hypothetical protein J3459_011002 [Metarhizium acridum]